MKANIITRGTFVLMLLFGLAPVSVNAAQSSSLPRVTAVNGRLEVGQIITVHVDHLSEWSANNDPRKLVPYLNGKPLTSIYPEQVDLAANQLLFHLQRTPASKQQWENLFHEPVLSRPVSFTVGLDQQNPFDTVFDYDNRLTLTVIPKNWGIVSLAVVLGMAVLLVFLSIRTNILRESGPTPARGKYGRYDLGRVQTAFWFFLISTSYFCIWMITGDIDTITPATLGLVGISAITAVGPRLFGDSRIFTEQPVVDNKSAKTKSTSAGFFTDILSDANGYSFHRFQMLLWTVLLGLFFAVSVYDDLRMPRFSGPVLALMGISAGTYLGFELLGRRSTADDLKAGKEVL